MDNFENKPYLTADGSHSLFAPRFNQHYHSKQGAVMESDHIFIKLGLQPVMASRSGQMISVFEMGLGTGLNALMTWKAADESEQHIHYTSIEAYPIPVKTAGLFNFEKEVGKIGLSALHESEWGGLLQLSPFFTFCKHRIFLQDFEPEVLFDVIYFDAFSPEAQPELWTEEIFRSMFRMLKPGGVLVTYSSKGIIRRAMQSAGFEVEKHPGPGYKREVVRAVKKG